MYVPTIALLAQMGVEKIEQLKDYSRIHDELVKSAAGAESIEESIVEPGGENA